MPQVKEIMKSMEYGPSPEANDHVLAWLEEHRGGFTHFIDGEFVAPRGRVFFDVTDPAHETLLATVAQGTADDVDAAVSAARRAFEPRARALPLRDRASRAKARTLSRGAGIDG
jgi:aldehyde dehydrogenase (NAD+)